MNERMQLKLGYISKLIKISNKFTFGVFISYQDPYNGKHCGRFLKVDSDCMEIAQHNVRDEIDYIVNVPVYHHKNCTNVFNYTQPYDEVIDRVTACILYTESDNNSNYSK